MVEFDVEGDAAFLSSLDHLGADIAEAVLDNLFQVAANLTWQQFCQSYNWRIHQRYPVDTYPGGFEYFIFDVPLPTPIALKHKRTQIKVYALNHMAPKAGIILCAVAQ